MGLLLMLLLTWSMAGATRVPLNADWVFGSGTPVTLPHTVVPLSFNNWDSASWEGSWKYTRVLTTDGWPKGGRVFLTFEGVLTSHVLTVSGHSFPLGTACGVWAWPDERLIVALKPWRYELTSLVKPVMTLTVLVNGSFSQNVPPNRPHQKPDSIDFLQPAGIYRDVYLDFEPQVYIADVFAKTANVLQPNARSVQALCTLDGQPQGDFTLRATLLDWSMRAVATAQGPRNALTVTLQGANLSAVRLWDVVAPRNLYALNVTLLSAAGSPLHSKLVHFGFREAHFNTSGFFLNGRLLKLQGVSRHQFFPYAGGALSKEAQMADMRLLKGTVNIVRQSHYPQNPAFLDAADRLGVLVWEEAPGWGYIGDDAYKALIARDVGAMILRDRNHPCIVVWGARTNECPDDVALWTHTQHVAKALDDSRQTSGAMVNGLWNSSIQQDVFSLNDYDWTKVDGLREPQLLAPRTDYSGYLITEAVAELSGPFVWYKRSDPVFNQQQQAIAHARVLSQVHSSPHYAGAINWVGMDYLSASGQQDGMKRIGIFDQFRLPRLAAAPYRVHVADDVVIEPSFYWRFDGNFSAASLVHDGALIWSNADTLKLLVDGHPFATLQPSQDPQFANLPHPPFVANFTGVSAATLLHVQAFAAGVQRAQRVFSADLQQVTLTCVADLESLPADGQAMTRVAFHLVDRFGNMQPDEDGSVTVQLSNGPGYLVGGIGSPFLYPASSGAVWIRSSAPQSSGSVTVILTHSKRGQCAKTIGFRS